MQVEELKVKDDRTKLMERVWNGQEELNED